MVRIVEPSIAISFIFYYIDFILGLRKRNTLDNDISFLMIIINPMTNCEPSALSVGGYQGLLINYYTAKTELLN